MQELKLQETAVFSAFYSVCLCATYFMSTAQKASLNWLPCLKMKVLRCRFSALSWAQTTGVSTNLKI